MIQCTRFDARDLTVYVATDEVIADEVIAEVDRFYAGTPTSRVLWDFTGASVKDIPVEEVSRVAAAVANRGEEPEGARTALVFSSDVGFGLGRMFENLSLIEGVAREIGVYRDRAEAEAWVTSSLVADERGR